MMEMIMSIHALPGPAAALPRPGSAAGPVARWRRLLALALATERQVSIGDRTAMTVARLGAVGRQPGAAAIVAPTPPPVRDRGRRPEVAIRGSMRWNGAAATALVHGPARLLAWCAERRRLRRAVAELDGLSEHVLADIGLCRAPSARRARPLRRIPLEALL